MHFEAELLGRFRRERSPLPSLYLGTSVSTGTALANDYGVESIFARPLEGLGGEGDALLAMSTSGTSPNVIAALETARRIGLVTVLLAGPGGADAAADHVLRFPGDSADVVQDGHQLIIHALIEAVEVAIS